MDNVIRETDFDFLGDKYVGKVRDKYNQTGRVILIPMDRHTSFDRLIAHIPHKGQILNEVTVYWMRETVDIVPNHILDVPDPNVTVAKKCTPLRIECVVRGYLTGSTNTSIWVRYQKGERTFDGRLLPDGMKKNDKLPHPVFDPTTKEEGHDRVLSKEELVAGGYITSKLYDRVRTISLRLFDRGQIIARKHDLILVDTKYEFGLDQFGELTLIDEVHTPDSSRYWQAATLEARLAAGQEPENFDKEFMRLWFVEHCDPYQDPVLPEAPPELVEELSRRYIAIYEQITGAKFIPGEEPALERMRRNLLPYAA